MKNNKGEFDKKKVKFDKSKHDIILKLNGTFDEAMKGLVQDKNIVKPKK